MARTVLVVDDSDVCSTLMEITLAGLSGVTTLIVRSVREALACLGDPSAGVTVVITDLELPDEDGFTLISEMRRLTPHVKTPIIVVSGVAESAARRQLGRFDIYAYFEKPCSPLQLRRAVREVVHDR